MTISAIIAWLVIGFVIGGLALLLGPGRRRTGVFRTLVSGIAGALLGGFITAVIVGPGHIINMFLIALIASALLIRAVPAPRFTACSHALVTSPADPGRRGADQGLNRHYVNNQMSGEINENRVDYSGYLAHYRSDFRWPARLLRLKGELPYREHGSGHHLGRAAELCRRKPEGHLQVADGRGGGAPVAGYVSSPSL